MSNVGTGWQALLSTILRRGGSLSDFGSSPEIWSERPPTGGLPTASASGSSAPSAGASGSGITGNPTLDMILGKSTVQTKRRPIDYLTMAATPVISGLMGAVNTRPTDRNLGFWTGALGGGLGILQDIATRPQRIAQAQRQQAIEDILLGGQIRGKPVLGVDPATGKGKAIYPGTQEVIPDFGPQPRATRAPAVHTREVGLPNGDKQIQQYDETKGDWIPATTEQTDASGQTRRVPLISKAKPEKPEKAPRAIKLGKDEQYYWIEEGKNPVATGVFRPKTDRPEREGDIRRAEKQDINAAALRLLRASQRKLGAKATPEAIANDALDAFQRGGEQNAYLRTHADEITNSIRTIARPMKSQDELTAIVNALIGGSPTETMK